MRFTFVSKCDFTHKQGWVNEIGQPQVSEIEIELILDETNILYKAEEIFRKVASLSGMFLNIYDVASAKAKNKRPF